MTFDAAGAREAPTTLRWARALAAALLILCPFYLANALYDFETFAFEGGAPLSVFTLVSILLPVCIARIILAFGRPLVFRLDGSPQERLAAAFVVGYAVAMAAGFLLGMLRLLDWRVVTVLLGVVLTVDIFKYGLVRRDFAVAFGRMISAFKSAEKGDAALLAVMVSLLVGWAVVGTALRAAPIELESGDVQQLYVSYLDEAVTDGGFALPEGSPRFSSFEISRGNGLHFLLATVSTPQIGGAIGALCYMVVAFLLAVIVLEVWPRPIWACQEARRLAVACGLTLFCMTTVMIGFPNAVYATEHTSFFFMEFQKFHYQTSFLIFSVFYFVCGLLSARVGLPAYALAVFAAIGALALSYPPFVLYPSIVVAGAIVFDLALARRRLPAHLALSAWSVLACALSLGVNYVTIGIPATNPFGVFRGFADVETFTRYASFEVMDYINWYVGDYFRHIRNFDILGYPIMHLDRLFVHIFTLLVLFLLFFYPGSKSVRAFRGVMALGALALVLFSGAYSYSYTAHVIDGINVADPISLSVAGWLADAEWGSAEFLPLWTVAQLLAALTAGMAAYAATDAALADERSSPSAERWIVPGLFLTGYFVLMQTAHFALPHPSFGRANIHLTALAPIVVAFVVFLAMSALDAWAAALRRWRADRIGRIGTAAVFCVAAILVTDRVGTALELEGYRIVALLGALAGLALFVRLDRRSMDKRSDPSRLGVARLLALPLALAGLAYFGLDYAVRHVHAYPLVTQLRGVPMNERPNHYNWDWRLCTDIREAVPDDAVVVPLNGLIELIPCLHSPLLPRGKVAHHYESRVSKRLADVALRGADRAAETYRELDVRHFLIVKDKPSLYAFAMSDLFDPHELRDRFALQAETKDFYILRLRDSGETWELPSAVVEHWRVLWTRAWQVETAEPKGPFLRLMEKRGER